MGYEKTIQEKEEVEMVTVTVTVMNVDINGLVISKKDHALLIEMKSGNLRRTFCKR